MDRKFLQGHIESPLVSTISSLRVFTASVSSAVNSSMRGLWEEED